MRVSVDREACIGCCLCVETCPEVFEMEGDEAQVKVNVILEKIIDSCKEAVENCPVNAIQMDK